MNQSFNVVYFMSFSHPCIDSFTSLISCNFAAASTAMCSVLDALHNIDLFLLLHLTDIPIGNFPIAAIAFFRNFRPGTALLISMRPRFFACVLTEDIFDLANGSKRIYLAPQTKTVT
jgi:hypothetical protein